jgi:hypothetical protein
MINIKPELMIGLHPLTLKYKDGCEDEILFITSAHVRQCAIWIAYQQLNRLKWW